MSKFLEICLLAAVSILAPVGHVLTTMILFIFADLLFGVWASYRRKEPITSAGLRRTVSKLFVYDITVVLAFWAEKSLSLPIPITSLVSGMVALTELKSILENVNSIGGGDLLKSIIARLGSSNADADKT